jgi:hypothetical protein
MKMIVFDFQVVVVVLGLLVVLVFGVLPKLVPHLKGAVGERRVNRVVRAAGLECLADVILPDGLGGLTQIDHIIKSPIGLVVVETKNYSGFVTGGVFSINWTQHFGRVKYPCINPLRQNDGHVKAVKALVPSDSHVFGQVVFVGSADVRVDSEEFSNLAEFERHLRLVSGVPIPFEVERAWAVVLAAARQDRATRRAHLTHLTQVRS